MENNESTPVPTAFLVDLVSNRKIPVTTPRCRVGRDDLNDIVISGDQSISRFHFIISFENGQYLVQDAKSRHGTFLNGNQIGEPEPINDGDVLKIGVSLFWFVIEAATGENTEPAKPVDVKEDKKPSEANLSATQEIDITKAEEVVAKVLSQEPPLDMENKVGESSLGKLLEPVKAPAADSDSASKSDSKEEDEDLLSKDLIKDALDKGDLKKAEEQEEEEAKAREEAEAKAKEEEEEAKAKEEAEAKAKEEEEKAKAKEEAEAKAKAKEEEAEAKAKEEEEAKAKEEAEAEAEAEAKAKEEEEEAKAKEEAEARAKEEEEEAKAKEEAEAKAKEEEEEAKAKEEAEAKAKEEEEARAREEAEAKAKEEEEEAKAKEEAEAKAKEEEEARAEESETLGKLAEALESTESDKSSEESEEDVDQEVEKNGKDKSTSSTVEQMATTIPDWCKQYFSDELKSLNVELEELNEKIRKTQERIKEIEGQTALTKGLRNTLLTHKGTELIDACKKVLTLVGWTVTQSEEDKHELLLENEDEKVAIARIIWTEDNAERSHLGQLSISQTRYWCEKAVEPKCLLIVAKITGDEAEDPSETTDEEVVDYAGKKNICLLSTLQLLAIYRDVSLKDGDADEARSEILESKGWLDGYKIEPGDEVLEEDEEQPRGQTLSSLLSA